MALSFSSADSAAVLTQLGLWAVKTTVLALAAGLGLAVFPVKSTSFRLFTWTAVLYAAFAVPMLGWVLPPLPIPLPTLRHRVVGPTGDEGPALVQRPGTPVEAKASVAAPSLATETLLPSASPRPRSFPIHWTAFATALYLVVFLLLLVRIAVGLILSRRLGKLASQVHDARMAARIVTRAECHKLYSLPRISESGFVSVPVTIGLLRPSILLPLGWRDWDDEKLDSILAHEMSHIARHDPWTQCIAVLHRAIFWFNPFSWWLSRHLADLEEQASDEAALSEGADRARYARTLLGFFETVHLAPVRVWWQGVSLARASQAEQRVQRILAWRGAFTMPRNRTAMVAIIACALSVVFLAAAAQPDDHNQVPPTMFSAQQQQTPPAAPDSATPSVAAPSAVSPTPAAPENGISTSGTSPEARVTRATPSAVSAPSAEWSAQDDQGVSYAYDSDDEQRFVIVSGKSDRFTMSGSMDDIHHVEKLKKRMAGDFIWFQRDEKSYIIRDQATIDRARKLWLPQQELGKKQEELGKQQEALGKQQEDLGKKMEQVRVNVPDMTAELDRLKAKLQKLGSGATMEQIGDLQSEIGELQSKIGEIQSQAGAAQSELGEQQGTLGEKQGRLGEQQGELGRQQAELARRATIEMRQLLDEALKTGTAKPEPQMPDSPTL
jgi:beta-lactamase regulating signal transducer with metallopeptidase domain